MIPRLLKLQQDHHVLLFGPRNCGKSTLLDNTYDRQYSLYIDLLSREDEKRFTANPDNLYDIVQKLPHQLHTSLLMKFKKSLPCLM